MAEAAFTRRLITIGVARCKDGSDELKRVPGDVERVIETLTKPPFGYEHVVHGLSDNPASSDVLRKLSTFFHSPDRTNEETVVVYCAGHGCLLGQWFYLACADTTGDRVGTAFPIDAVLRMVSASRVKFVLLILDTCFAGAGATEIMRGIDEIERTRALSNDAGVHVLVSARSRELAEDGLFTPHLCDAVIGPEGDDAGHFLSPGGITDQVNKAMKGAGSRQRAKHYGAGSSPFFDNPVWARRLTRRRSELAAYWEPNARGGGWPEPPHGASRGGKTRTGGY